MARRYLQVPYAEKDQAKALGARWDAARKKWYVPDGADASPFARWAAGAGEGGGPAAGASKAAPRAGGAAVVARTPPADKDFTPYAGTDPPWD